MSFCSTTANITSDAQMNTGYPPNKSIMPASGSLGIDARDPTTGRILPPKMQTIYDALVASGHLVSGSQFKTQLDTIRSKQDDKSKAKGRDQVQKLLDDLPNKELQTMKDLKEEYCFTFVRYSYALNQMFTQLTASSTAGSLPADKQATIQMYLAKSKEFNIKLNDLIQISNFIASKRASDASEQSDKVNALNTEISSTFDVLKQHQQILSSENATADLRKRMVEFSEEKNRSANNLLQLYGALNIVAIGLLLYIYRS
jgi:hypothetical protein